MIVSSRWQAPTVAVALATALLVAGSASGQPASVAGKQAEAQRVLAQVRQIDSQLAHAAEAYNAANIELDRIRHEQRRNERYLRLARTNLGRAQATLEARLVALYTSGDAADSTLEVLLGAQSLDDLISRIDAADRVSSRDAEVLGEVTTFGAQVQRRKAELSRARAEQAQVVAARAAQRRVVEQRLAERQRLLGSIRSEIERIQAAERRRQAEIVRQARARLSVQDAGGGAPAAPAAPAAAEAPEAPAPARARPAPEEATVAAAPPARYGGVVGIAMRYLGTPYRWGGASPKTGFDCSGFIMYVYAQVGVSLPHNAAAQYGQGTPVSKSQLQPGDLVFFNGLGHNGLYIGGGQFIHSPRTGDVVKISSLSDSWYAATWVGARRIT